MEPRAWRLELPRDQWAAIRFVLKRASLGGLPRLSEARDALHMLDEACAKAEPAA